MVLFISVDQLFHALSEGKLKLNIGNVCYFMRLSWGGIIQPQTLRL